MRRHHGIHFACSNQAAIGVEFVIVPRIGHIDEAEMGIAQ
jgi:hypothetical protein